MNRTSVSPCAEAHIATLTVDVVARFDARQWECVV